jgi:hypothetical protein
MVQKNGCHQHQHYRLALCFDALRKLLPVQVEGAILLAGGVLEKQPLVINF